MLSGPGDAHLNISPIATRTYVVPNVDGNNPKKFIAIFVDI